MKVLTKLLLTTLLVPICLVVKAAKASKNLVLFAYESACELYDIVDKKSVKGSNDS